MRVVLIIQLMKKLNHIWLLMSILCSCDQHKDFDTEFSSYERAGLHSISLDRPAIGFFEGALLGNGAMGAVVTTRPDAVVIYFGHNNVWDIRIAENNREEIGNFRYVFDKVKAIPDTLALLTQDPWYRKYSEMAAENYGKPYPRPFPCGSVLLGFDLRNAEMIGHSLDISNGLCEVFLLTSDMKEIKLQIFTTMDDDRLWMRLTGKNGEPVKNIFDRIRVMPDPSTPAAFPPPEPKEDLEAGILHYRQILPYQEPETYDISEGHPGDKVFSLTVSVSSPLLKTKRINWDGNEESMGPLEGSLSHDTVFTGCITLREGINTDLDKGIPEANTPDEEHFKASLEESKKVWEEYWNKSGVVLDDKFLESIWYRNLYFLNCSVREGVNTPGLFANWSYNNIGTAWHGDYHMNYNTQQPFWVTFSSNHLEKNLSYVSLIEFLMNVSRKWAKEYYDLPGAYFPHSAYPVDMTMNPYPVPHWGWEICETPWAVQGLWWHYLYSGDTSFLRLRGYEPIKAATEFLTSYLKRPEARGSQWNDDRYHIFPTIPPELYALRPGFKFNYDCIVDLTLVKFIFRAFEEAVKVLELEEQEKDLITDVRDILQNYPEYPVAESEKFGKVFVSVPGEHSQVVYNVPLPLTTVFPGEEHGLHSDAKTMELLKNTFRNQQNEGGNDLVFKNIQAARIGMLDLEKFKRQINYCLLPNGTASDRAIQVHGRYNDFTNYGFMDNMGVWFENFALPAVINECLMQGYNGTLRLFPNWPAEKDAEFHNLRAAGAFLVSAALHDRKVKYIRIISEAGNKLNLILPWPGGASLKTGDGIVRVKSDSISVMTRTGEELIIKP